jgi:hypothetical protein
MALTGPGYPTQQFQNSSKYVRFEVITVVDMNIFLWDVTPRSLLDVCRCFIGMCCLRLQVSSDC